MSKAKDRVTKRRDLRTAKPLWAATHNISVETTRAPASQDYDVIIVGAGVSGALVAEALCDGRRRVLVIDRREPVRGSTLASTAMIQHEIDIPLHRLAGLIGEKKAARAWRRSAACVAGLRELVQRLEIDCGLEARQTLYLAGDAYGARALAKEADLRLQSGLDAHFLKGSEVRQRFGIDRTAAIVSNPSASANPGQLAAGLLAVAQARGAEVISPVDITDVRETRDGVIVATGDGRILSAADVVFCTGYEFLTVMQSPAHRVISTWAIASEPAVERPDWLDDFLVWEGSDPYLYFRSTIDGRIIAGGEDEDDPLAHQDKRKARRKYARIAEKIGGLTGIRFGRPAYGWSAPFGTTTTGLPIIDRAPGTSHVYVVMGFGGNGITFSKIAAEIVAARVGGLADTDEDLFGYPE